MSGAVTSHEEWGLLRDRLVAVETKLDLVLGQLVGTHQDHEARLRVLEQRVDPSNVDHESRIRKLERAMWIWAGAAGMAGGGLGAFLANVLGA